MGDWDFQDYAAELSADTTGLPNVPTLRDNRDPEPDEVHPVVVLGVMMVVICLAAQLWDRYSLVRFAAGEEKRSD